MGYRLSRKAEDDLVDIYVAGVRDFGVMQAERYYFELQNAFEFLARFPHIARERAEIDPPIRVHPHKAHIIAYIAQNDEVLILRIRHGREDWFQEP